MPLFDMSRVLLMKILLFIYVAPIRPYPKAVIRLTLLFIIQHTYDLVLESYTYKYTINKQHVRKNFGIL